MVGETTPRERSHKGKNSGNKQVSEEDKKASSVTKEAGKVKKGDEGGSGDAGHNLTAATKQAKLKKKTKTDKEKGSGGKGVLQFIGSKIKYIFLIIFVPPFLNYASLQRETIELKPEGELYDIGWGQKLFLSCKGKGPPTVVLDAPTGLSSDVWALMVEKLSEHANVCVYDRAGLGYSERPFNKSVPEPNPNSNLYASQVESWNPFTVERMVDDLHNLISSSSQQPRPLILVGAELGAIVSQFYAHLYESEILGLVLINPLSEDLFLQPEGAWVQHWFGSLSPTYQSLQLGAALGITRLGLLLGVLKQPITGESIPEDVILRQKYLLCHPRHLSSVVDEHHFINETFSQMRTMRKIKSLASNISVSVLTGNYYDEQMQSHLNKAWAKAEQSLLSKFPPNVQHLVINGADRHMLYRKPTPIIEAVLKIVRKWKRTKILSASQSA
ncbi:uncharacterized protein LOC131939877 [Physella acuta]|uniref:uncharacterized protein LOC131939877 n=1 Tax=Physella acuta TaxID=109671 RepID=UPI0027DAFF34|nr:uncharacterized protein LOC131939877 [Physella acuta]